MKILAVMLLLVCGCATRQPGQSWPYVTDSYSDGDVIYNGVGIRF